MTGYPSLTAESIVDYGLVDHVGGGEYLKFELYLERPPGITRSVSDRYRECLWLVDPVMLILRQPTPG